jgi:hypothetical protein
VYRFAFFATSRSLQLHYLSSTEPPPIATFNLAAVVKARSGDRLVATSVEHVHRCRLMVLTWPAAAAAAETTHPTNASYRFNVVMCIGQYCQLEEMIFFMINNKEADLARI